VPTTGTQFLSDSIGAQEDSIGLVLNGERILTSESWEHTESVLSQPSAFSLRLGSGARSDFGGTVNREILQRYPKGTTFQLYIGNVLQATGRTDGVSLEQSDGGPAEITIRGRDALARLHDTSVKAVVGVKVATYPDLVWYALQQVALAPQGSAIDPDILTVDNTANRKLKAGVPVNAVLPHRTVEQILEDTGLGASGIGPNVGVVQTTPLAKLNETWHQFLRRYLDRAGLMLWAGAKGNFVLGSPNGNQTPTYTLFRPSVSAPNAGGNIRGCSWQDDASHRHTEAIVYGRGGGKVVGRVKSKGGFADQEMVDAGYAKGFDGKPGGPGQPLVFRDVNVHSGAEASYFARRKLAEERRAGWRLEYRIAGLTLPATGAARFGAIYGGGAQPGASPRAVITPDTVVSVNDQELGIEGDFYVETCVRQRNPYTTTTVRLMRKEDLVFGGPGGDE
jgi:hypothetical protein